MRYLVISKKRLVLIAIFLCGILAVLFTSLSATSVITANSGARKIPIYSVERDDRKIALTFNVAWDDKDVRKVLDILDNYGVKSTFFFVGEWVQKYPESASLIYSKGHELASHSQTHADMTKLSHDKALLEITQSQEIISKISGEKPLLFRAPSGAYDNKVIEVAEEAGVYTIQWDVDSVDWKNPTPEQMYDRVTKNIKNGSIILFHIGAKNTPEALPAIIEKIKADGYEFSLVSDLIYKEDYYIDNTGRQFKKSNSY